MVLPASLSTVERAIGKVSWRLVDHWTSAIFPPDVALEQMKTADVAPSDNRRASYVLAIDADRMVQAISILEYDFDHDAGEWLLTAKMTNRRNRSGDNCTKPH